MSGEEQTNEGTAAIAANGRVDRNVMRLRLAAVRTVCRLLLPPELWVGKHFGAYTQRFDICLGKLDGRGVMQGVLDRDVGA